MSKLNDEDRLKRAIHEYVDEYGNIKMTIVDFNIMLERNRVDAEPVRHGHWNVTNLSMNCSQCGGHFFDACYEQDFQYCPYCGARMEERKEDE